MSAGVCRFLAVVVASLLLAPPARGAATHGTIQRVVTMLQMMLVKVDEQATEEEELFDKFMCSCKKAEAERKALKEKEDRIPQLHAHVEEGTALEAQLTQEIDKLTTGKAAAVKAVDESKAMRKQEKAAFDKEKQDYDVNIKAIDQAAEALRRGSTPQTFLQTDAAQVLQGLLAGGRPAAGEDREVLAAFLQGTAGSETEDINEILGIIDQMGEDMRNDLEALLEGEASAQSSFEALTQAKDKEILVGEQAIRDKWERLSQLKLRVVQYKHEVQEMEEDVEKGKTLYATKMEACQNKEAEYEELKKDLTIEKKGLQETVKFLTSEEAMRHFKTTLATNVAVSASLLQVEASTSRPQRRHLRRQTARVPAAERQHEAVKQLEDVSLHHPEDRSLGLLARRAASTDKDDGAEQKGFEKITKLVDSMLGLLKQDQEDDTAKKGMCVAELARNGDKKAALEQAISEKTAEIDQLADDAASVNQDIKNLHDQIAELDKSVDEATAMRKQENRAFSKFLTENHAADAVLEVAKKRLQDLYHKPEQLQEMSMVQKRSEEASSEKGKKPQTKEGEQVLALIESVQQDLNKEFQDAKAAEDKDQAEYEDTIEKSKVMRTSFAETIVEKEAVHAGLQATLKRAKIKRTSDTKELEETDAVLQNLHKDCDWLLENFAKREKLRGTEVEGLHKTKAVLSDADD